MSSEPILACCRATRTSRPALLLSRRSHEMACVTPWARLRWPHRPSWTESLRIRTAGTRHYARAATSAPVEPLDRPDIDASSTRIVRSRTLFPPSPEQQVAIDTLLHSKDNIIVDACAGSGKTTTILHLAQAAPGMSFLVLVYNRRLLMETEERVQALGLENITVLNYHTLGARYYTSECATDQGLKRVVEDDMPVLDGMQLPDFSVLVMDEQQDMTPIFKRFIDKVVRDKGFGQPTSEEELRVVVLGDQRQEVYGFSHADSRFLTMAARPEVFGYINKHAWVSADQTMSNRVTKQNVDFINQQMLKQPLDMAMRAVRDRDEHGAAYPKPRYIICDPTEDVLEEVLRLLGMPDMFPNDIIVLAPSVRGGASPAISLANSLARRSIPVHRSDSDVSDVAPEVAQGKVLICTYHQAKGIERKACIVLGFDQNYHLRNARVAEPPTAANNPQYVAATRALEHLILIHDYRSAPLPFVNLDTVEQSCDLIVKRPMEVEEPKPSRQIPRFDVTGLCRNLSDTLITACLERLEFRHLATPSFGVQPRTPTVVVDKYGLLEGVANVTGTAVPAIFQWRQMKGLGILEGHKNLLEPPKRKVKKPKPLRTLPQEFYDKLEAIVAAYEAKLITTDDILFLANLEVADKGKDITKVLVIPPHEYNWLTEAHCKDIHYTLKNLPEHSRIPARGIKLEAVKNRKFPTITHGGGPTNPEKKIQIIVNGIMDIARPSPPKTVWEIKHTDSLQPEHILQVVLYMLLLGKESVGFLVSSCTGQVVEVLSKEPESLMEILQLLVDAKSGGTQHRLLNTFSDEEFLQECRRDFAGLVGKCALPAWFSMRPSGSKYARD